MGVVLEERVAMSASVLLPIRDKTVKLVGSHNFSILPFYHHTVSSIGFIGMKCCSMFWIGHIILINIGYINFSAMLQNIENNDNIRMYNIRV